VIRAIDLFLAIHPITGEKEGQQNVQKVRDCAFVCVHCFWWLRSVGVVVVVVVVVVGNMSGLPIRVLVSAGMHNT